VRGKRRVDDRRVISGIVQVIICGCRWSDAPSECGPRKTLYNRFVRWAVRGMWQRVFMELAGTGGPPAEVLLDSTHIKVHRSASAGGEKATVLSVKRRFGFP
jgi:transposase